MIENALNLDGPNSHLFQFLTFKDYIAVNASSTNSIHDLSIFKYQGKANQNQTQRKTNHTPMTIRVILPAIVLAASFLVTAIQRFYS